MLARFIIEWLHYAKTYVSHSTGIHFVYSTDEGELGQGLVEYAMILVMVAVTIVVLLTIVGPSIRNIFANIMYHVGEASES